MSERRTTKAATDDEGVIRVVATEEYDAMQRAGIAAPFPGEPCCYVYHDSWEADATLWWRPNDDAEWEQVQRPDEGGSFELPVGSSVRLESPPRLVLTGMI